VLRRLSLRPRSYYCQSSAWRCRQSRQALNQMGSSLGGGAEKRAHGEQGTDDVQVSAIAASIGVTALAIAAVHYRFSWHVRDGADFPTLEAVATLLLTVGGVVSCPSCRRRCFDCFCVWVI